MLDAVSGETLSTKHSHGDAVTGIAILPDPATLVTVSADSCVHVWSASDKLAERYAARSLVPGLVPTGIATVPAVAQPGQGVAPAAQHGSASPHHRSMGGSALFDPACIAAAPRTPPTPPMLSVPSALPESERDSENLTPAQRELLELHSPQPQPKAPTPSGDGRPRISSIFRFKDATADAAALPDGRRGSRVSQAWSEAQLTLLNEYQLVLHSTSTVRATSD